MIHRFIEHLRECSVNCPDSYYWHVWPGSNGTSSEPSIVVGDYEDDLKSVLSAREDEPIWHIALHLYGIVLCHTRSRKEQVESNEGTSLVEVTQRFDVACCSSILFWFNRIADSSKAENGERVISEAIWMVEPNTTFVDVTPVVFPLAISRGKDFLNVGRDRSEEYAYLPLLAELMRVAASQ